MDTKQLVADAESLAAQLEADSDHWAASDNRFDAFRLLRKLASALSDPAEATQAGAVPAELSSVKEVLENGAGFWRTCSGCYETVDGHPVGHYPHSSILGCTLGGGCSECGGIGAVWDDTDYDAMADAMLAADPQAPVADAARAEPHQCVPWRGRGGVLGACVYCGEVGMTYDEAVQALTSFYGDGGRVTAATFSAAPTHQPARASEAGEASFEKWFAGYHEEACKQFGGIDCTNPKGIAEDAWNAARAPAQQAVSLTDDARDAAKYRAILAEMQVGAVSTQLPLSCSLYWIGPECNDARHADEVIDAALQSHSEGEAS
jgi:hypothetical protein